MSSFMFKSLPAVLLALGCHVCMAADAGTAQNAAESMPATAVAAQHGAPLAVAHETLLASSAVGQVQSSDVRCRQLTKSARCAPRGGSAPRRS